MRYENNLTLKPGAHWASLTADKNLITGNSFLLCPKKSADFGYEEIWMLNIRDGRGGTILLIKSNYFVPFFGRIEDTKKTFRN